MRKLFAPALMLILLIASCGQSIDKNSFEGRVASVMSDYPGVNMSMSVDLKSIIQKSGIKDGAIPKQYLATIQPFIDALYGSVNLDKQIFIMPILNYGGLQGLEGSGGLVLFDVKDVNRLKKEFKDMGFALSKKGDAEYAKRDQQAVGIFKGETGFILMNDGSEVVSDQLITDLTKSLDAGAVIEGVIDYVNLKADMTVFSTGDKGQTMAKSGNPQLDAMTEKMVEISKGTYMIGQMSFKSQEAVMTFETTYGDNIQEYLPMVEEQMSQEAKSIIIHENTFAAFGFSMKFEKIIDMVIQNLDEKTKSELNRNLAMLGGLEKFKTMFTGEFAMSMAAGEETPNMSAFLGIGDKKQVKTMLDGFGFFLGLEKSGNGYKMEENRLQFTDKGLLFASSKEGVDKMIGKRTAKTRSFGGFKFGSTPVSAFVDIKALAQMNEIKDEMAAFKHFDYFTMEMSEEGGKMVIKSTRKNQNVLRTIVESIIEAQRLEEIRQEEEMRMYEEMYGSEDWSGEEFEQ